MDLHANSETIAFTAPARPVAPIKTVALSTGVTLPYIERGNADGVPVVLLHGVTDSLRSFEPMLAHFPESVRVFALTQRGHGDADKPAGGYRTRDYAADVAAFVQTLGLGPVLIVGHSFGTTNALRFAIDSPYLTRGLFLIGTFATYRNNPGIVEFWDQALVGLKDPVDPGLAREFQEGTLARPVPRWVVDQSVEESLKVPARIWRDAFAGLMEDDFSSELNRIAAPTKLVWGERDNFVPRADQDILLARIAGSRLAVIEGGGHAPHWEDPAWFAAEIVAFAESVVSRKLR
jgi:non-heme chloroperoxidase